jgi:hypothetical protein
VALEERRPRRARSRGRHDEHVAGGEARHDVGEAEAARASSTAAQPTSSITTRHSL